MILHYTLILLCSGMNCILGDEMGLGKTLQTLSLFAHIKEKYQVPGPQDPQLVICPLSVLASWQTEAARWLPSFSVLRFHGTQAERERLKNGIRNEEINFDICLTTYEAFVAEDSWFKARRWTYCVLDEGHRIKNAETNLSNKLRGMSSLFKLLLTGTPVQNNLIELWGLLSWLYPNVFTPSTERLFRDSFDLTRGSYSVSFLKNTQALLNVIMLRRTKDVIEINIPPRNELTVFIPMTEAQRFWTYRLLTRMDTLDLKEIFATDIEHRPLDEGRREIMSHITEQMKYTATAEANRWRKLMNLLMQLRKVCDHPYLLQDASPSPYVIGEHIVASSSKFIVIDKILSDVLPKGERVLIFSVSTTSSLPYVGANSLQSNGRGMMLDILEDFMELRSIPYGRLDGSTSRPRRTLDIKLFQQEKSPFQVFLISTKAGGLGINLTRASTVIMCDSDWNPQNDLQAIARAHRIGQTKTVKVFRLICQGSVEDQMLDRLRRKLFLSLKVMSTSSSNGDEENAQLKMAELIDILRKGSSAIAEVGMDFGRFFTAPIDEILNESRQRENARNVQTEKTLKSGQTPALSAVGSSTDTAITRSCKEETLSRDAEEEERQLLSGVAQVQSRLFEGRIIQRAQNNCDIAREWQEVQKRARVDRLIKVDGIMVVATYMGDNDTRSRPKYESEDWCIYCRDGGEVVLCNLCPRVFHPKCHGITRAQLKRLPSIPCSQHSCAECGRNTAQSGGMLFRCQTCPKAFCEDCLPEGDLDAVGDVLPEFVMLGFGAQTAYYIRCHNCHAYWAEHPEAKEEEMGEIQQKIDALRNGDH
ncbi:P-loop containing nucleoside triphosphate hydrolase protein [Scleroderma yunnanense]